MLSARASAWVERTWAAGARAALIIDPEWAEAWAAEAEDGEHFDLVIDVRPTSARCASPYPAPCLELFADHLCEKLGTLALTYPPGSVRVCCVCWSGARAIRAAFHMRASGWDAAWWALSASARHARRE